jgi:glucose-6-phosphate isomerase
MRGFRQKEISRRCALRFSSQKSPSSSVYAMAASSTTVPCLHMPHRVGGRGSAASVLGSLIQESYPELLS